MWICSKLGFFSIVQKGPEEFHVRARFRRDLENLALACGESFQIRQNNLNDYRYRVILAPAALPHVFRALAASIDYPNFKAEISHHSDQAKKLNAYHNLWTDLLISSHSHP
jgi:hypothetical protein